MTFLSLTRLQRCQAYDRVLVSVAERRGERGGEEEGEALANVSAVNTTWCTVPEISSLESHYTERRSTFQRPSTLTEFSE